MLIRAEEEPVFTLYDLTGRAVKKWNGNGSGNDEIDMNSFANGMYLLNVSTKSFNRTVRLEKQ